MFTSLLNKWLIVRPDVKLTERIDPVITALDPEFKAAQLIAHVTSGMRSSQDQLELIRKYAILKGVAREFPRINSATLYGKMMYGGQTVYMWQPAWSRLLNIGMIINPPLPAVCLFDYFRNGVNKKGFTIGRTPHASGSCFDVGGGPDGVEGEFAVLKASLERIPGMRGILLEHDNNCVHVDCV